MVEPTKTMSLGEIADHLKITMDQLVGFDQTLGDMPVIRQAISCGRLGYARFVLIPIDDALGIIDAWSLCEDGRTIQEPVTA